MPIHPDWQKVLDSMIQQYGKKKGTSVFYATMKKKGIDYSKPAPSKDRLLHIPIRTWHRFGNVICETSGFDIDFREAK